VTQLLQSRCVLQHYQTLERVSRGGDTPWVMVCGAVWWQLLECVCGGVNAIVAVTVDAAACPMIVCAVCRSVLQRVAVGCSGLQWVAVGCSGLQWVAVGCSGLQWVAMSHSGCPSHGRRCCAEAT